MFNIQTQTVDKLSVPFGVIIGPCTILSNLIKVVADLAKIVFYGIKSHKAELRDVYHNFKQKEQEWETNVSPIHKPDQTTISNEDPREDKGTFFYNKEHTEAMNRGRRLTLVAEYVVAEGKLNDDERLRLSFDNAKKDFVHHLSFIGVGVIRTIPILGGAGRCLYNARKAKPSHQNYVLI